MFDSRCETCPVICEMRSDISHAEDQTLDAVTRLLDYTSGLANAMADGADQAETMKRLYRASKAAEAAIAGHQDVIDLNEEAITQTKRYCFVPHGVRQKFALEGVTRRCLSLVELYDTSE